MDDFLTNSHRINACALLHAVHEEYHMEIQLSYPHETVISPVPFKVLQILTSSPFFSTKAQLFPSFMPSHGFSPRSRHSESDFVYQLPRKLIPFPTGIEHRGFRASRNGRFQLIGTDCKKMEDGFYIRRCLELARKAIGCTSPNPMVGCVIVKNGEIIGEGFHPKAGQPHAEVFALREAGSLAENATAYVSLEPCNHYGRTPPCTEALINAKVKQVIVGMVDPNPIVASKGVERLKTAGIDVIVGVEEMLCQKLNEAYIHRIHTGKPFVTVRYSLSLNGRMLSHLGRGAEESGGYYSKLLQKYDGIVVSGDYMDSLSTLPTSLEPGASQPFQIIIAGHINSLRLPSAIINSTSHFIVVTEKKINVEPKSENVETVLFEKMTLTSLLEFCGCRGLCSILLDVREENGALTKLLEGSLQEGLLQKVVMELCPVWNESKAPLPSFGLQPRQLKDLQSNVVNESVLVEGYL